MTDVMNRIAEMFYPNIRAMEHVRIVHMDNDGRIMYKSREMTRTEAQPLLEVLEAHPVEGRRTQAMTDAEINEWEARP